MKFLIPTDFSKNAEHAINYASVLARALNASLLFIHVNVPPVTRGNIAYTLLMEEIGRLTNDATVNLNEISKAISEEYRVSCENLIRMGNPVEQIINEAKNNAVDLIIMGTTGASGINKFLFGSNTASVIEHAPCPILAVPNDAVITLPRKIIFATNYQDNDMQAVRGIVKLAGGLYPELTILHVSKEALASERDLVEQFSKAVANEINIPQPYYYVMPHENTLEGIDLFIKSAEADLIALSTRKRGTFEKLFDPSLTKKMAYQANFPLLVFQSSTTDA